MTSRLLACYLMASLSSGASSPALKWYPTITPYRLAFFVTTAGLGITKGILVSQDQTASSTTVEWVAGVVVALSFQFLGEYEHKPQRSLFMKWTFTYDCLNIPKAILRASIPVAMEARSSYPDTVNEAPDTTGTPHKRPIITAYRLLVSASVAFLGLAKMVSAYLGVSTAMNTLDWIVAVPLALSLYCLGTFEDQECNRPRRLFDVDYSWALKRALKTVKRVAMLLSLVMIHAGAVLPAVVFWPVFERRNRRRALSFRYIGILCFSVPLYLLRLLLFVCDASMLFLLPSPPEMPDFLGFIEDSRHAFPLHLALTLITFFLPGLGFLLVLVPIWTQRLYNNRFST